MLAKVRAKPKMPPHYIFHEGLIKLLIFNHLGKVDSTWEHLLFLGGFIKYGAAKTKDNKGKK